MKSEKNFRTAKSFTILVDAIAEVLGRTAPPPRYIRKRLMLLVIGLVVIVTLVICLH